MIQLGRNIKGKISAEKALAVDPTVRRPSSANATVADYCALSAARVANCCITAVLQHEKSLKRLEKAKAGIEKDKQG